MGGLSFDTVSKKLNALLESVDPEKTTTKDIFRHLTDELGSEVKHHKQGIREAIGKFFDAQDEEGVVKETRESDDFVIQLDDQWHLSIVDVSDERHVEISSKVVPLSAVDRHRMVCKGVDDERREEYSMRLSRREFEMLFPKTEAIEWANLDVDDTIRIDMDFDKSLTIEKEGYTHRDILQWRLIDDGGTSSASLYFETDMAVPKTIELYKDEILARLQQSAAKTPIKSSAEKMLLQRDLISAGVKRSMSSKETSKMPPRKAQKTTVLDGDHVYAVEIDRNIYVTVSEFKGKMRADLRRYYMDKNSGKPRPTPKGLSMDKDQFLRLLENIEDLKKAVEAKDTDFAVEIGTRRRATVSDFTGRCLVDLREFYQPKGTEKMKPGKKGISFDAKLLDVLLNNADAIMEVMV